MKLPLLLLTIGLTSITGQVTCFAQDNGLSTVDSKGTLEDIGGLQIKIKGKDDKSYTIVLDPQGSSVDYKGTADASLLGPGLLVRFVGDFDQQGNAQGELKQLEIFQPKSGRMLPSDRLWQTPGIYPADEKPEETKPAANSNTTDNNSKSKRPTRNSRQRGNATESNTPASAQKYRVVGQITRVQGNKLQISTGAQMLLVETGKDTKVNVLVHDGQYCQPGDEVHVTGLTNKAQPELIQARLVTITGAKPLSANSLGATPKASDKKNGKPSSSGTDAAGDARGKNNKKP